MTELGAELLHSFGPEIWAGSPKNLMPKIFSIENFRYSYILMSTKQIWNSEHKGARPCLPHKLGFYKS